MPVVSTEIENLYRPAHETKAALTWICSAITTLVTTAFTPGMPLVVGLGISGASLAMATLRGSQAWSLFEAKARLAGNSFWIAKTSYVDKRVKACSGKLWLGLGFRWTQKHTQRATQIQSLDTEKLLPPEWALKLMKRPHDFSEVKGEPWIHGIDSDETDIAIPWSHVEGNWNFFGTTGAGKTRLYELLAYQVVKRGDVLIVFDPKYDKDLRDTLVRTCKKAGRPKSFCEFHPAFPERSVRIDPIKNFSRATEIPSRIADILGGDPNDSFTSFCWRLMNAITLGLLYVDERPSLKKLRFYAETGPEPLVERVLKKFFMQWSPGTWEDQVRSFEERIANKKGNARLKTGTPRQQAMVEVYHTQVEDKDKVEDINGLMSVAEHAREHLGKMIAVLIPLLTKLTSAPLDELLSPDYDNDDDQREIIDMEKAIRDKRVLYIATDSLADATVGSAIAAILLSDLRAVAGHRYNYAMEDATRIHILVDEACEVVTPPLIAIMNKGRGAGMITYLATQNFSDYIWKFGNEDAARMVIGNGNNRLSLRVVDTKTQDYMSENFGETTIYRTGASIGSTTRTEEPGLEFGGSAGASVSEQAAQLFPGYLLGKLPDLHYVAAISGGKIYKGRLPKISHA